ncbi:unnamed protein product [Adineta steineri]|uniref:Uncharacterized protein n=1 Tax=Adineta steineri TaxID=433720 RepID=A0A814L170_9BILA|nr:unnamed protein product [Adineta steineri]CAF1106620.1 unnamed protein product [Adineta steineri]CAF1227037.1 unnamed protein product [Adineta steineri]
MCLRYSDTIAREQQIRELNSNKKNQSIPSTVQPRQDESHGCKIFLIVLLYIVFAVLILARFTIKNGRIIQEIYYALKDTRTESLSSTD